MNKDVKIAAAVIAGIILIAIFDRPRGASPDMAYEAMSQAMQQVGQTAAKASSSNEPSCYHNGIELKGKVQFVDSFPDLKIKFVSSFADIDVQFVSSFPDDCGQWQEVSSFPDFTVQVVDSFPDIEVRKVSSFPGMN
ncbi:hypothetical protein [Marinicella meishanensis]|uniref:hypothetical protein n=1 Tax=Marinicella meishanensis TaxID=2873263 RepID=UPI001CBF0A9F|nr:hypothetical protein [Marinicella sp. NBU2979]